MFFRHCIHLLVSPSYTYLSIAFISCDETTKPTKMDAVSSESLIIQLSATSRTLLGCILNLEGDTITPRPEKCVALTSCAISALQRFELGRKVELWLLTKSDIEFSNKIRLLTCNVWTPECSIKKYEVLSLVHDLLRYCSQISTVCVGIFKPRLSQGGRSSTKFFKVIFKI